MLILLTICAIILTLLVLLPYYVALHIRKYLYDKEICKSHTFEIPVISVGNITVGGTGKTPHVEMLVSKLKERYKLAVLSLGYKRKTKGFYIVNENDTYIKCGDEPLQIKSKFPDVIVAVCKKREVAIRKLIDEYGVNCVILDDGLQYRKVQPSTNLLLVKYSRPINKDKVFPFGHLRDLFSQSKRVDAVIVSKSPNFAYEDGNEYDYLAQERTAVEEVKWRKDLKLRDDQRLFFSIQVFSSPLPIFPNLENRRYIYSKFAICFSGIASDKEFISQLAMNYCVEGNLKFADHRQFSKSDIARIVKMAQKQPEAVIITTEKDSMRIKDNKWLPDEIKTRMFYLPVSCKIIPQKKMDELIEITQTKK